MPHHPHAAALLPPPHRRAPRRPLALLALTALGACSAFGGMSNEDRDRLALFQQNAADYYGAKRYAQALDAVEQGLEIAPDDYKLLSIRGWCHLITANRDRERLRLAEAAFDQVWDARSAIDHDRHALLGYARVKQEIGVWHRNEAETAARRAKDPSSTTTERTLGEATAAEHTRRAERYWSDAELGYRGLVEREELLRLAYKGLMELAVERGRYADAVAFADQALDRIAAEKQALQVVIAEVMSLPREREARAELADLDEQEVRIRAAVAEMHFRREDYGAAIAQLDALLTIDPFRSIDYYNRALAHERNGDAGAARADYDRFIRTSSLPSSDERVQRAEAWLRGTSAATAGADR